LAAGNTLSTIFGFELGAKGDVVRRRQPVTDVVLSYLRARAPVNLEAPSRADRPGS
jgi:hypothetical protein